MEHPRRCINHKDLEFLPSQPTHFHEYVYEAWPVSVPSLGHHQTLIIQESEYNIATKNYEAGDLPLHNFLFHTGKPI
jgi:hypothetical protein